MRTSFLSEILPEGIRLLRVREPCRRHPVRVCRKGEEGEVHDPAGNNVTHPSFKKNKRITRLRAYLSIMDDELPCNAFPAFPTN